MQACRLLRNSSAIARTGASINTPTILAHSTSPLTDLDRARTSVDVSASDESERVPSSVGSRVSVSLQKTVSLLPRTLATDDAVGPESSHFWINILERSITELNASSHQLPVKATVAVCGFDKWARSHDLVTALLEDPFTSDPTYTNILRDRWKDASGYINIEHGKPAAYAGELTSPSDWLQRFPHPIQLIEFPDLSSLSSISDETDTLLLNSDVLLLLCDPIVAPLSDLAFRARHLIDKHNTILVLVSGSVSDHQFVSRTLSNIGCQPGHILFVDPAQALDAVTALQANPTSPSTIDRYQRGTLNSRISTITAAINEILSPEYPSKTPLLDLRQGTALSQVHGSLSASFRSVEATKTDVDRVVSQLEELSSRIQRTREDAKIKIFGKAGAENRIEKALALSAKEMSVLLGSLTFWKMIWRVDEIGPLLSAAVQGQWCKGLENQLILQTGRLEFTQQEMSISASSLVSAPLSPSLRSPVLENQLEQLKRAPTSSLIVNSLTQPIYDRRSQLIQHTTIKLHREAQNAVLGAFGGVLSGAGLGWWLAFGEHILSLGTGTDMGTAIGSGALLAVSGIRWAMGKWERARRRWTQDSARVGEGLARDLQDAVQHAVDSKVTIVASTACKGMQDLMNKRRHGINQLHRELCDLDTELRVCAQLPASRMGRSLRPGKKVDIG